MVERELREMALRQLFVAAGGLGLDSGLALQRLSASAATHALVLKLGHARAQHDQPYKLPGKQQY